VEGYVTLPHLQYFFTDDSSHKGQLGVPTQYRQTWHHPVSSTTHSAPKSCNVSCLQNKAAVSPHILPPSLYHLHSTLCTSIFLPFILKKKNTFSSVSPFSGRCSITHRWHYITGWVSHCLLLLSRHTLTKPPSPSMPLKVTSMHRLPPNQPASLSPLSLPRNHSNLLH